MRTVILHLGIFERYTTGLQLFNAYLLRLPCDVGRDCYALNCVQEFLVYNKNEDNWLMRQCHDYYERFFTEGAPKCHLDGLDLDTKTCSIFKRTLEKDERGRSIFRLVHGRAQFWARFVFDGSRIILSNMKTSVIGLTSCSPVTSADYVLCFKNLALRQSLNIFQTYSAFEFCKKPFSFKDVEFHFFEGPPGCGKTKEVKDLVMLWVNQAHGNEYNFGNICCCVYFVFM